MRLTLEEAVSALDDLEAVERAALGKQDEPLPDALSEDSLVRALLREARALRRLARAEVDSDEVRDALLSSATIDWRGATSDERRRAVEAMTRLVRGLPSRFADGARAVLDRETGRVVNSVHRGLGERFDEISVDPSFALTNRRAVDAISRTTSIFFSPEYERQAGRFRERAQRSISRGLEEGLGSREIGEALQGEFREAGIHRSYWDTVAAVHVNRARSFSAAATYASAGVTEYQIVAILDRRTTTICRMMDGTRMSVAPALDRFDALEDAEDLDEVRETVAPFMRERGRRIETRGGQRIATVRQDGTFDRVTPRTMNRRGVTTPPFHFRCRSTLVPVL